MNSKRWGYLTVSRIEGSESNAPKTAPVLGTSKVLDRALVVASDFPFPPTDGARGDIWEQVKVLVRIARTVELVVTVKSLPDQAALTRVRELANEIHIVNRQRNLRSLLSVEPFQVTSRRGLDSIALTGLFDAVILEGEYVSGILDNPHLNAKLRILRVQNNSVKNFQQLAKSEVNPLRRFFYLAEAAKSRQLFHRVAGAADLLWFISKDEYQDFIEAHPEKDKVASFVPPSIGEIRPCVGPRTQHCALFIGTLGLAPNARAVEWFLKNVHGRLNRIPGYRLVIAGNTLGNSIDSIYRAASAYTNVVIHENPQETADLYQAASVFINPVMHGTGVKLKTIDAIRAGLPVVSTSIGAEGTALLHGEHILIADSPNDFADAVHKIFLDSAMGERLVAESQSFLRIHYDQEIAIRRSLANLSTRPQHQGPKDP